MKRPERADAASVSLLEQLRQSYGMDGAENRSMQAEDLPSGEVLPDGYVRRSPVQPYSRRPGEIEKQLPAVPILCGLAAVLILLGIILWRFILR